MPALESDLRRQLENVCVQARDLAEAAARSALQKRGVDVAEPFAHFGPKEKDLRNRLRARGRQAGDVRNADKTQSIDQLTQELAYEFWHRMLFARFLAENHLLMHPDGVAVSLEECDELAPAANPRAPNGFVLAARYASTMLPQIFRTDDVLLEIDFAPEHRLALERLLASLPSRVFTAADSLGWVYQFWQTKKKEEINKSGQKIDGRALPAVTQLFTEHYMVEFLLHNTIGAWWTAKEGVRPRIKHGSNTDKELEYLNGIDPCSIRVQSVALPGFEYLRWRGDGVPAAGRFEGWPKTLAEFTMLDPCCGSGHFLVAAFRLLVPMRMHDEGLSARDACDAVLRQNLFGLELDPRCTQIAAFALALAAWTYPGPDGQPLGHRPLPALNIACSGQGVVGTKEEWARFANGDGRFREGMGRLYDLFQKASTLGSLINPRTVTEDLFALGFDALRGTLERTLKKLGSQADPDRAAVGVAAQGIALAASLMSREFTLVATNVPYLARGKQADELRDYIAEVHLAAKADLATVFVERCLEYCASGGATGLVTPQNWSFLGSYKGLREWMLRQVTWNVVAKLGPAAFDDMNWWAANTMLSIHTAAEPMKGHELVGLDASAEKGAANKGRLLLGASIAIAAQSEQLLNPDARISLVQSGGVNLLCEIAKSHKGITTNDDPLFLRKFWEFDQAPQSWVRLQSTVDEHVHYGGREHLLSYEDGKGRLRELAMLQDRDRGRDRQGVNAWGKIGVAVSCMRVMPVTLYEGTKFDTNVAAIVPRNPSHLPAIWCFCKSPEFYAAIRRIDQKVNVTNATLVKVPFDLERWQKVAAEEYPNGLPAPHSNDPTQWLFKGHPNGSTDPLQVAVARLLGYRWPEQEADDLDALADRDGIVPIPSVRGEPPAADRLLDIVRTAFVGQAFQPDASDEPVRLESLTYKLLTEAGCRPGTTLDNWLRNDFFEQHCKRFHNRPFIWHIWDGRKDGFSALVNYHMLDHKALENLTYSYLGDWITAQSRSDSVGADLRLAAAQALQEKLKRILAGEPPYDIFVRWKPLREQAIGWHPDLNDGVRMNIRPFIEAGILRKTPNIKWGKDRGKEPEREQEEYPWFWKGKEFIGDRVNDVHLTTSEKLAARKANRVAEEKRPAQSPDR